MVRWCFAGPMSGMRAGRVPNPAEILAERFSADGMTCRLVSVHRPWPLRVLDTLAALLRWRRSVDVVVVMVYSGHAFAVGALTAAWARALRLHVVLHLHGGNLPDLAARRPKLVRRVLALGDAVVAPSRYLRDELRDVRADIEVIPNLLDTDRYEFRAPNPVIEPDLLWMRTFEPTYQPTMAVDVLAELRRRGIDARLTMAGQDQGSLEATRAHVTALGVDQAVTFAGFLDEAGKQAAFGRHDAYLNTTRVDNAPVTLLEVAASGLPIVTTDVGGIPSLFERETDALMVPVDAPSEMADAVQRLLTERGLGLELAQRARRVAIASSWPVVRDRWLAIAARIAGESST